MGESSQADLLFKFIIIGDEGTGKSCLLRYFLEKKFKKSMTHTVGVEFGAKVVTCGGKSVKLQIWDTAGQERYRSVTKSYYRGAIGCLLVYDVTSRDSYNHISSWLNDAKSLARPDMTVVVVGNKIDLKEEREVTLLEASGFAQEHDLLFMEASALTGEMVDEIFLSLVKKIIAKIDQGLIDPKQFRPLGEKPKAEAAPSGCAC